MSSPRNCQRSTLLQQWCQSTFVSDDFSYRFGQMLDGVMQSAGGDERAYTLMRHRLTVQNVDSGNSYLKNSV